MRTVSTIAILALLSGCGQHALPSTECSATTAQGEQSMHQQAAQTPGGPKPARPSASVSGAVFSGDGKLLLISYRIENPDPKSAMPKPLALWEVASGKKLWAAGCADTEVFRPVAFLPGGQSFLVIKASPPKLLGTMEHRTSLELWDAETGKHLRTLVEVRKLGLGFPSLSGDGKVVLLDGPGSLELRNVGSGELVRAFGKHDFFAIHHVTLSPDGKRALAAGGTFKMPKSSLILWDVATGEPIRGFERSEGWGAPMAFSADSKVAVVSQYDPDERKNRLVVLDAASGKEVRRLDIWGKAVAFTVDGRRLAVGSEGEPGQRELALVEVATGRVVSNADFASRNATTFAFSLDARLAFTGTGGYRGSEPMKLRLWDLAKGELVRSFDDPPWTGER